MRGRTDDVINVSGHRMSTAEIEHTVISHKKISDAASIAIPDDLTGEAIVVFFVSDDKFKISNSEISDYISEKIGKIAKPKHVFHETAGYIFFTSKVVFNFTESYFKLTAIIKIKIIRE